ncbi:hypothetical protein [Aestuariimicrobium ganziense]|uniref:hypothetical protein n=1 Tax=Aestuariimicrobium ganziense TaxID=2773677 RepID=UPI001940AACE|nr:hypothetical protein [Aestuariimicrobium ganziense]
MVTEVDDVVEIAVGMWEFGANDEAPVAPTPPTHWQRQLSRAALVVTAFVVAVAAGVLGTTRTTIPGPTTTVTATQTAQVATSADPLRGVVPAGEWRVGFEVPPGEYLVMVEAASTMCEWTTRTRVAGTTWSKARTQRTSTYAVVTLTELGDWVSSTGCHWRRHG